MPSPQLVFVIHLAATLFMTGVIWFVQVVHYPMFALVGRRGFEEWEAQHSKRTTFVVAPIMLIELATGVMLVLAPPASVFRSTLIAAMIILAVIWFSTWLLQVPQHRRLGGGFDEDAHGKLVRTNWIRTVGWSMRAVMLLLASLGSRAIVL